MVPHAPRKATRNDEVDSRRPLATVYPVVKLVDGHTYHVDEMGLIYGRRQPCDPPLVDDILACMTWLEQRVTPRKTPSVIAYNAKHCASRWLGRYVSNGTMIVAADRAGFTQSLDHSYTVLNTVIGISLRTYRRLPEVTGFTSLVDGEVLV